MSIETPKEHSKYYVIIYENGTENEMHRKGFSTLLDAIEYMEEQHRNGHTDVRFKTRKLLCEGDI